MIPVRNGFVPAISPVFVAILMRSAFVVRSTRCRVLPTHTDFVFINVITVRMMEVPVMKIVLMTVMLHGHMSAVWTVHVRVRFVNLMIAAHLSFSFTAFELAELLDSCPFFGTSSQDARNSTAGSKNLEVAETRSYSMNVAGKP